MKKYIVVNEKWETLGIFKAVSDAEAEEFLEADAKSPLTTARGRWRRARVYQISEPPFLEF